jgi:hypothetical protein
MDSFDLLNLIKSSEFHKNIFDRYSRFIPLNFSDSMISENELKYLTKAHTIDLSYCEHISDDSLIHLQEVSHINLSWTSISDNGLAHLKNVKSIDLSWSEISGNGLIHLKNAESINLRSCKNIKDESLDVLENVKNINIGWTAVSVGKVRELLNRGIDVSGVNLEMLNGWQPMELD